MKNALVLHGTDASSKDNWFPWLKKELKIRGWRVWVPDLPKSEKPSMKRYAKHIFSNKDWEFNEDSVLIGHSSGAVAIFGILTSLPESVKVDTCIFVGVFKWDLGWSQLNELWDIPIDFEKVKKRANRFVFLHSDNDPYCPLSHAKEFSEKLDGELIIKEGAKHFALSAGGPQFKKLPTVLIILL
jgi:predicted alpha/beta hydrolase family esterase